MISTEPTPYRLHLTSRLARELPEARISNLFVFQPKSQSAPWQMQIDPAIRPVWFEKTGRIPGSREPLSRQIKRFREIRDYLVNEKIQLVIINSYMDIVSLLLLRWAHAAGLPVIVRGDSNIFAEGRLKPLRRIVKRRLLRWVIDRAAGLMPAGTCGQAYFRLYADHDKPTFLMPYEPDYDAIQSVTAADAERFAQKYELPPGRRRLMYSGRLVPVKRVDVLVDAFVQIAGERPEWDLVIAGDGELRQSLADRVPQRLADRVKWLGFLQFDEIRACYRACHVLVHPSEFEPWGLIINEAVAAGLPVVTTEVVGAAVNLVRNRYNGLIVPPRKVDDLAAALRDITLGDAAERYARASGEMLRTWREGADPVAGVRAAIQYFSRRVEAHGQ